MVGDEYSSERTLAELDSIIELDREAAARIAATVFRHEVASAIVAIGEINQVANARISADSQVAAAKMMMDAEVSSAMLMSNAEIAIREIQQMTSRNPAATELPQKMILDIGRDSSRSITESAQATIDNINAEAGAAIAKIRASASGAIGEINEFAVQVEARLSRSEEIAKSKLGGVKGKPRTNAEVFQQAEAAMATIREEAALRLADLQDLTNKGINSLNSVTEEALKVIGEAARKAERRIIETRDKALARITAMIASLAGG